MIDIKLARRIKEFYPTKENGLEWFADWDEGRTVNRNSFDPYDSRFGLANGTGLIIGGGKARIRAFNASHILFVKRSLVEYRTTNLY